ncbi:metal-dependent hydrolase family protein [Lentzea aerocolonigenes]|uniref:metal-dependent hydrolase family protein n=1 Tax=Lentzea aerocolonigenes TaxID=68170 RepID=UPI0009E003CC|nr:amidohydrolase family protein [Lentzea aerocolonigenes]MCP2248087.1 Imidazolonepropionase [Lentzea aerocolonigenes]
MYRIDAEVMIPGRGSPLSNATVVIDGDRISYAGPRDTAPAGEHPTVSVPVVMPGLWDCHVHFAGVRDGASTQEMMLTPAPLATVRAAKDAEVLLQAGFTSVRDLGGYGVHLAAAVAEGTLAGPSIYSANKVISQTGGHSDAHRLPYQSVSDPCRANGMQILADGVDECLKAVRLQLREGARVIKVCTSGGVVSELDDPYHRQFSDAELRAVVEEAGRAERAVAAHCHGKAGVLAAAAAGCTTIEHGSQIDEETAAAIKESGAVLVPTRTVFAALKASLGVLPPHWRDKVARLADEHLVSMQVALSAGVQLAAGTDLGLSRPGTPLSFGRNGEEFGHLVAAGMTPLQAIEAGTAAAPLTLGGQAPRSGLLEQGYDADVIALSANPVADISVLARPELVTHVWRKGKPVKQ